MATYYVSSVDGNDSDNGTTWALAKATLAGGLAVATSDGDIIKVSHIHQEEVSADTTLTIGANINIISVNRSSSDALTAMGTGGWVGNSSTNYYIRIAGTDEKVKMWGMTFRTAGSTLDQIVLAYSSGLHVEYESCYFWVGTTANGGVIELSSGNSYSKLRNCTIRFGGTGQFLTNGGHTDLIDCTLSSDGATPTTLTTPTGGNVTSFIGCDLSLVTGTLVGNAGVSPCHLFFDRCKLGSGVTYLAAQTTNPTKGSPRIWLSDCYSDGTEMVYGYADAMGSILRESGIYYTGSEAGNYSWKVVTTANATYNTPFETPWIDWYNTGTSEITPRIEILRDGSTTAYTDAQVWGEFSIKLSASSTQATSHVDRQDYSAYLAGTTASNQANGAGTGAWTGDTGAWSGKVDSGAAVTPGDTGYIRGRVVVGGASLTLYVDPVIRTA